MAGRKRDARKEEKKTREDIESLQWRGDITNLGFTRKDGFTISSNKK